MKYGPHGGGHGHPDKLNFVLYANGQIAAPDPGTARYGVPIQGGWYRTTLAHNTLVVDETSQKSAEGECLAFGSDGGVDYAVARAGDIYDGVSFVRSVALIEDKAVLFIDQIRCEDERTLDIAYHNRGAWDTLPDGTDWIPPDKPGYEYLRSATVREVEEGIDLFVGAGETHRKSISLMAGEPTQVITTTGLERHAEDRVPMVIFRRHAKETAFVWCVGLDGEAAQLRSLSIRDSNGDPVSSAVATSVQIEAVNGQKWVIIANPDQLSLNIGLPDGTDHQVEEVFGVR
jgi:hypothetical protein